MNGNQFYVHPGGDMTQGLQGLGQTFNQIGERKRADALRQEEKDIATAAAERFAKIKTEAQAAYQSGDPDQIAQFNINNPEMGEAMNLFEMSQHRSEKTLSNSRDSSYAFLANPTRENAIDLVSKRKKLMLDEGVAPEKMAETDSFMERFDTDPAKLVKDTEARLAAVDTKRFVEYRKASGNPVGGEGSGVKVASSDILEDGTTIQSLSGGGTAVYGPEGDELKGKARADAIQVGRAEKVSNLRKAAGGKRMATLEADEELKAKVEAGVVSAKDAAAISTKAFDKLEGININIANIDEGIRLIDEGAETGPVMAMLPSIRQTAIKLDNLQGRLGLDVLRSTTFGALSAAELKFALSTALPQGLEGPELKEWLVKKKAAQEKLADYVEASAIYLGTPGNTVAGWAQKQVDARQSDQTTQTVTSQDEYDNLPSGALFIDSEDGKQYRKP